MRNALISLFKYIYIGSAAIATFGGALILSKILLNDQILILSFSVIVTILHTVSALIVIKMLLECNFSFFQRVAFIGLFTAVFCGAEIFLIDIAIASLFPADKIEAGYRVLWSTCSDRVPYIILLNTTLALIRSSVIAAKNGYHPNLGKRQDSNLRPSDY